MSAVAPYALMRVAALPLAALAGLRPPRLAQLCDEVAAARALQAELRARLEDELHAAVPRAGDDVRARRALIELKRAIHGGRRCKAPIADLAAARTILGPAIAEAVDAWLAAQATVDAAYAVAERALADDTREHVRPRLRALAIDPALDHPLSLASPELWRSLRREAARAPTDATSSKAERSLLGYVVRASAKANPFSTFAWIGAVELHRRGEAAPRVDGVPRWVRSVLSRATVEHLERTALASASKADAPLRRNSGFRRLDATRVEVIVGAAPPGEERPWRHPIRRVFRTPPPIGAALATLPDEVTTPALVEALRGTGVVGASEAAALASRLVAAGVFEPVPSFDVFADAAGALATSRLVAAAAPVADRLAEMTASADAIARAAPDERVALLERVRALEAESLAATRAPGGSGARNAVIEHAAFAETCGGIGDVLTQAIADAGTTVRGLVRLDPAYLALRDRFVARFGAGGVCTDAIGFLHEAAEHLAAAPAPEPAADAPCLPAAVTMAFQIAARDADAAARGDALLVVNKLYPGVGWLTARHASGDTPAHEALRARMRSWLRDAMAPAEPIDVPQCGHVNDLQAHPRLTDRVLAWPPEPLRAGTPGVVHGHDVRIIHDPTTDRLALEDAAGRRLAPLSLGAVLLHPTMGAYYLLWRIGTPHTIATPHIVAPADPAVRVEHRPRKQVGNVVIGRESWWIDSRWLAERVLARRGAHRALAAAEELAALGIPPTFFARPLVPLTSPHVFSSVRKPIWIDSRNPSFLELLGPVIEAGDWTVLSEPLPGPDQIWTELDGHQHVAELHAEMILR